MTHRPDPLTAAELCRRASVALTAAVRTLDDDLQRYTGQRVAAVVLRDRRPFEEMVVVVEAREVDANAGKHTPQPPSGAPTVIGSVTGKVHEGNQCLGMPRAICHACGLGYRCWNPDCEQTGENPSFLTKGPRPPTGDVS